MVHTSTSRDYTVEEITQVGRKGRSHGHKYDGADFDESVIGSNPIADRPKEDTTSTRTTPISDHV
ncbi:hypothetical protein PDE_01891 [Penicillium oxalicum 114-2]|uniref:Uncharacterized protein n=1 Tax=Penicillium oxalicum (strain 114-2 / CGMCC 5302) TaxID=933388 RepID=S7ZE38_PENO1|nr:hypothetical protein PDE_01891 [Penicillium oxalicum 114-2]